MMNRKPSTKIRETVSRKMSGGGTGPISAYCAPGGQVRKSKGVHTYTKLRVVRTEESGWICQQRREEGGICRAQNSSFKKTCWLCNNQRHRNHSYTMAW